MPSWRLYARPPVGGEESRARRTEDQPSNRVFTLQEIFVPSLSDKLRSLGVRVEPTRPPPSRGTRPIEEVVPGALQENRFGQVYVVETRYPAGHRHGNAALLPGSPLVTLTAWARDSRLAGIAPTELVFLDTETTGLMGGTGTYAFLVGVGRLEEDEFRLVQLFMRDPARECAVLAALADFLLPAKALVTFNGKSFDAPLLNSRYVSAGMNSPLPSMPQLDLLPLARRLWRDRLPSRALGELEGRILGATRSGEDVPGCEIPAIYFDYLRTGDARPLGGVFYHNAMDLLALAALLTHTAEMLEDPSSGRLSEGSDRVAVGRLLEDLGRPEHAADLYIRGLEEVLPLHVKTDTVRRLASLFRRRGDLAAAAAWWQDAARDRQIYAHVELAKYYEHRRRDLPEAERWTLTALALVEEPDFPSRERGSWQAALQHRLQRLKRKAGPSKGAHFPPSAAGALS